MYDHLLVNDAALMINKVQQMEARTGRTPLGAALGLQRPRGLVPDPLSPEEEDEGDATEEGRAGGESAAVPDQPPEGARPPGTSSAAPSVAALAADAAAADLRTLFPPHPRSPSPPPPAAEPDDEDDDDDVEEPPLAPEPAAFAQSVHATTVRSFLPVSASPPPALLRRGPSPSPSARSTAASSPPPPAPAPSRRSVRRASTPPTNPSRRQTVDEDVERQTLLRQLDLLRLKFKQSIIPNDIERQKTPVVKLVVERNMIQLKRARGPGDACQ